MEGNERKNRNYKKKNRYYNNRQYPKQNTNKEISKDILEAIEKNKVQKTNDIQEKKTNIKNNHEIQTIHPNKALVEEKNTTQKETEEINAIENNENVIENKKIIEEPQKKEVVEDYVADIFNTPYAKQSIQNAVNNKKEIGEEAEFTETIVSNEIKEKLQEMKERQIRLDEKPDNITPPKKNYLAIILLLLINFALIGFIYYHYTTYNHKIKEKIITKEKIVEVVDENYVFLGDSITEKYDIEKYFKDKNKNIINSGISGNLTKDILNNMKKRVYNYNPSVVFLLIGVNDVNKDVNPNEIISNIKNIIKGIKENRSLATIYVESIYPTGSKERNEIIIKVNTEIEKFCKEQKITYINLYDNLVNKDKVIDGKYTKDGIHLSDEGYDIVTKELEKYVKEEK